jgi:predicted TIM-barrel fold metal-dependent hydrolase
MPIDDMAEFFPELKIVLQHGREPWAGVCVKLMVKWPNISYMSSAIALRHIPQEIIYYVNAWGADRVMFASAYPLLRHERCMREARELPFRDQGRFTTFASWMNRLASVHQIPPGMATTLLGLQIRGYQTSEVRPVFYGLACRRPPATG